MDIRQHKLAWRWTDSRYAVLRDDVLNALLPVDDVEAELLHKRALSFLGTDSLSRDFSVSTTSTEHLAGDAGINWLVNEQSQSETEVVLSWGPTVALKTSWALFVGYWQEFCYPASADLVVFPPAGNWVLLYHHEEEFHFGNLKIDT